MSLPLVAVVAYRLPSGRVTKWNTAAYAVPETYVLALRRAGVRPVVICPPDPDPTDAVLEPFDGLLLIGGGDVEPRRYGGGHHPELWGLEPHRDELEMALLREADESGVPTLAICRGAQILNVAFGGTLIQHLPDAMSAGPHGTSRSPTHEVKLEPSSRLSVACGVEVMSCASYHHQAVDRLGDGLRAVGWSDDGLVEAIERESGWMIGVQWHPEETAGRDRSQQALFDALTERARDRGSSSGRNRFP
jgi:putative glutamine amidotransferase